MLQYSMILCIVMQGLMAFPHPDLQGNSTNFLIEEFLAQLPQERINSTIARHLTSDPEFQAAIFYLQSNEFKNIIKEIRENADWIAFKAHLKNIGFDVDPLLHCLFASIDNIKIDPKTIKGHNANMTDFLLDISIDLQMALLRTAASFANRVKTDPRLKAMFEAFSSTETGQMVEKLLNANEFKKLFAELGKLGFNLQEDKNFLYGMMQWNGKDKP